MCCMRPTMIYATMANRKTFLDDTRLQQRTRPGIGAPVPESHRSFLFVDQQYNAESTNNNF